MKSPVDPLSVDSGELPILDTGRLETILENDTDLILNMLMEFNGVLLQDLELISRELENIEDFPSLRKQAHRIKGSSINLGASALADMASQIEDASVKRNAAKIHDLETRFSSIANDTLIELKRRLEY